MSKLSGWEPVIAIHSYFDGPRSGVALCRGKPHFFESEFSESDDDYTDRFFLMEVEPDLMPLIEEAWEIWLRWCRAFHRGETLIETHPALEQDRDRHFELKLAMGDRLRIVPNRSRLMRAEFRWTKPTKCWDGAEVQWQPLTSA